VRVIPPGITRQISISSSLVKPAVWYMAMACFFDWRVAIQSFRETGHLSCRRACR
jgi:hypothetical protein